MAFHTDTALLLIDPYNDFIHPDGKIYDFLKESIETTNTVENIKRLIATARANKIPIYYCLHQNHKKGNYDGWNRMTFFTNLIQERRVVEEGSWGAQIYDGMEPDVANGDVVIAKHWNAR
jgi:nicotinamidase-related amidase